jgi:hypothetical protein
MKLTQEMYDKVRKELGFDLVSFGKAEQMPGTSGFTMVVFRREDVPVGTEVFIVQEVE